jgi:Asp-tRNA(Asn)/Glu-tRNA(Gln) amidotransferase B subunit
MKVAIKKAIIEILLKAKTKNIKANKNILFLFSNKKYNENKPRGNANQDSVSDYKAGKEQLLGFFVGQVMKKTGGKANPQIVNALLKEYLNK